MSVETHNLSDRWRAARDRAHEVLAKAFDPSQPRDEQGRWTDGGGGDGGGSAAAATGEGRKHPGKGYSKEAYVDSDGVIHTPNVEDAARALGENKKVSLDQPRSLSVLINKLGEISKSMIEKGEKAPVYDLCNVTLKGTNLFCVESHGIPRVEMPQLNQEQTAKFIDHLKAQGHKVENGEQFAAYLRATQNELNGGKVAKIAEQLRNEPNHWQGSRRIIVSKDDYILDGHHNWGAKIGLDAADNILGNDTKVNIARVNISITDLLEEAEKFTGGKGKVSVADKLLALARARATLERLAILLKEVDYIQDPTTGRFEGSRPQGGGEGGGSGGGGGKEESKPSSSSGKGKKQAKISDFSKDGVQLDTVTRVDSESGKKFLEQWNGSVGHAPGEFKTKFLGGIKATMNIGYDDPGKTMTVYGHLLNERGQTIGEYKRIIDFDDKKAKSSFFKLYAGETGKDVGKQMLAANVEMYEEMGIEKVEVYANINVGGYAWARYGYVPTAQGWNSLKRDLLGKIDRMEGRSERGPVVDGYMPEAWDELTTDAQETVRDEWMRQTFEEFHNSEVENWREQGGALDQAKDEVASLYGPISSRERRDMPQWVSDAFDRVREARQENGDPPIPYTDQQLHAAIALDYEGDGEGGKDPEITFLDKELQEPKGAPPPEQGTLPGIEPPKLEQFLTEDMRDEIESELTSAFNKEAEDRADDIDPPEHLADSARDYQDEYWETMDERERYRWGRERDLIETVPIEEEEEDFSDIEGPVTVGAPEPPKPEVTEAQALRQLAQSNNMKAIWAIADSKHGKELLLRTSWDGVLNLKDEATMTRFKNYVKPKRA